MPEDDSYFAQFIKEMKHRMDDHDILVQIATTLELMRKSYEQDKIQMAVNVAEVKNMATSAHERIDQEIKFRWMVFGGGTALAGMTAIITLLLKVTGKI